MIKSAVKSAIAVLLYYSGVLRWYASWRLRNRAVVLMYHRVLPSEQVQQSFSHRGIIVTPETFARHLDALNRFFRPLSLNEFHKHLLSDNGFPPRSCLVTFDDGWEDNHTYAAPELMKRTIPAVVFVATNYLSSDRVFWQEQLGYLVFESLRRGIPTSTLESIGLRVTPHEDQNDLRLAVDRIIASYRGSSYDEIRELIDGLSTHLADAGCKERKAPVDRFMTWQQVRELLHCGLTVASHTCSHRSLPHLSVSDIQSEMHNSKALLERNIGRPVSAVAYPSGHFDQRSLASASATGYTLGFSTEKAFVSADTNPFLVPRYNVHESGTRTVPLFLCRALGLF